MANGLNEAQPIIHQALHGYADGHRELALSFALKPRDQRTLLSLSDISGAGARLDEEGYLTGYPLADSGVYALARTWPAPEMARPGCVWTHTLLIDFTGLGTITSLSDLLLLFRRPMSINDALTYNKAIPIELNTQYSSPQIAEKWARQVLAGLYGKPHNRIVAAPTEAHTEDSVLAIWSQQWPRLRRNFRFCTFTINERSSEAGIFDLQVLPPRERNFRGRFVDAVDAEIVPTLDFWLKDAVDDLLFPNVGELRSFFRQLGAELSGGRTAFRPLCQLRRAVRDAEVRPEAVANAIDTLQTEFSGRESETARILVAKAALRQIENLDENSFEFLWSNLNLLDAESVTHNAKLLGEMAWRRDPRLLVPMLENNNQGLRGIIERLLSQIPLPELIHGLDSAPDVTNTILTGRPEILEEPSFWTQVQQNIIDNAFDIAKGQSRKAEIIVALLRSGRDDLVIRAVHEFGSRAGLQALAAAPDEIKSSWVVPAVTDRTAVADFLVNQASIPKRLLYALARALWPDAIPNDYATDPWLIAWQRSTGSIDYSASLYILAFLFSRTLGPISRSQAELAKASFEGLYAAAARSFLSEDSWRLLDSRLPWSFNWFAWDRCQRLRAGVTNLFVERDLSPELFGQLVNDVTIFAKLVEEAATTREGRRYLRRVWSTFSNSGSLFDRAEIIKKAL